MNEFALNILNQKCTANYEKKNGKTTHKMVLTFLLSKKSKSHVMINVTDRSITLDMKKYDKWNHELSNTGLFPYMFLISESKSKNRSF